MCYQWCNPPFRQGIINICFSTNFSSCSREQRIQVLQQYGTCTLQTHVFCYKLLHQCCVQIEQMCCNLLAPYLPTWLSVLGTCPPRSDITIKRVSSSTLSLRQCPIPASLKCSVQACRYIFCISVFLNDASGGLSIWHLYRSAQTWADLYTMRINENFFFWRSRRTMP